MPQTRFVPGGRIVEEFIPDDPADSGYHGFSGDRPMLAFDMFGQINTGDPKIEMARRMAAQRHDEVTAQSAAEERRANPRFGMIPFSPTPEMLDRLQNPTVDFAAENPNLRSIHRFDVASDEDSILLKGNYSDYVRGQVASGKMMPAAWGNLGLDTPEKIDAELFAPIRKQYGIPESDAKNIPRLFEIGNSLVAADPRSGSTRTIFTPPEKKLPEKAVKWQISPDRGVLGNGETISLTPSQFVSAFPTLPEFARTNSANIAQAKGWGYDVGGFTPSASVREVVKIAPNGKRAVFDANTKKFLRYAD